MNQPRGIAPAWLSRGDDPEWAGWRAADLGAMRTDEMGSPIAWWVRGLE
ncbi:hypothetical protein [Kribbella sp. NPDC000426]